MSNILRYRGERSDALAPYVDIGGQEFPFPPSIDAFDQSRFNRVGIPHSKSEYPCAFNGMRIRIIVLTENEDRDEEG